MPSLDLANNSRWACRFNGCEKSFARKEHLTRHERTHASKDSLFVCKVCSQKFNRSDSLQRHLARHGDDYKPCPSGRSKKACITCHKAKIKCDGNHPCSKCRLKGTACRYEQAEEPVIVPPRETSLDNVEKESTSQASILGTGPSQNVEISSFFHAGPFDLHSLDLGPRQNTVVPDSQPAAAHPSPKATPTLKDLNGKHLFDLTNIRICKDPGPSTDERLLANQAGVMTDGKPPPTLPEGVEEGYVELYFTHFHHRWSIIHRPAHDHHSGNHKLLFKFCTLMIGGWLSGTGEGREYALAMYDYLVHHISAVLNTKTSADVFQDTLPSSLCQAAVATIVFALHTGAETRISKAVMLRNTLIAVLREVGFFDPATIWADEKPGFFIALHLSLLGERQRLAAYLFRVDIYLSMVRGHRSLMSFHELHYPLPSTYAIWNADGLHVFANRMETEPASRHQTSMWTRIRDVEQDVEMPTDEPMLIEDIQLFMCVIQPRVAHFWNGMRSSCFNDPAILRAECPRPRLEALKRQLDLISLQLKNPSDPGTPETLPAIHYHGYEEPTEPGFDKIVSGRMKDLLFDALMLFHLLQMQLSTDIQLLSQIAKDCNTALGMELPEARRLEREQRVSSVRTWTTTCLARRALYHAAEVLVLHRQNKEIETKTMDPIALVALVNASLIVSAYCVFSGAKAPDESEPPNPFHTELTEWCNGNSPNKGAREMWINMAMGLPVEIERVRLCSANVGYFTARFRAFIPEGWELADVIAPGISKEWV